MSNQSRPVLPDLNPDQQRAAWDQLEPIIKRRREEQRRLWIVVASVVINSLLIAILPKPFSTILAWITIIVWALLFLIGVIQHLRAKKKYKKSEEK